MKVAIVIPSYQRIKKLQRCIDSIYKQTYKDWDIFVYADNNDFATKEFVKNEYADGRVSCHVNDKQEYVVGSWNKGAKSLIENNNFHAMLLLVDDVELYSDCIEKAVSHLNYLYPDGDGVIGLNQKNDEKPEYTFEKFGQVLIGKKFIERYKEVKYQIWSPDYKHFYADYEFYINACNNKKFYFCEEARLKHFHPGFYQNEIDDTHWEIRKKEGPKDHDIKVFKERQKRGLIWGKTWGCIK